MAGPAEECYKDDFTGDCYIAVVYCAYDVGDVGPSLAVIPANTPAYTGDQLESMVCENGSIRHEPSCIYYEDPLYVCDGACAPAMMRVMLYAKVREGKLATVETNDSQKFVRRNELRRLLRGYSGAAVAQLRDWVDSLPEGDPLPRLCAWKTN